MNCRQITTDSCLLNITQAKVSFNERGQTSFHGRFVCHISSEGKDFSSAERCAHWTESLMTSKFCHASAKTSPPPLIALPPSPSPAHSCLTASPLVHPSVSRICNTSQVSSTAPCFAMRLSRRRRPPASHVRISLQDETQVRLR